MKAILPNMLILLLVFITTTVKSQNVVSYRYDNTGRRTERVIVLKSARPELLNDTTGKEKQKEIFEEKIGEQKVIIYPNPTRGEMKVEILDYKPEVKTTIRLYTLSGKILLTRTQDTSTSSLDLSAYPTGTYVLKIVLDDKESEWKIIKE